MNYHVLIDHWFVNDFIATAELVDGGNNVYLVSVARPSKHVNSKRATFAPFNSPEFDRVFNNLKSTDRVYVHWFDNAIMQYIDRLSPSVELYLVFWGGDFFSQTDAFNRENYDPLTRQYIENSTREEKKEKSGNFVASIIRSLRLWRGRRHMEAQAISVRKRFLRRLNYFCHWNYSDLQRVTEKFGGSPAFLHFYYGGGLDAIPGPDRNRPANESARIWLGNSDTATNNHLDAIELLKKYRIANMTVVCPLSYGFGNYGEFVAKRGVEVFGDKWISYRKLLSLGEYIGLQQTADVAIMFHRRSQASGNIIAFIKMGKKLFLKKESTIYGLLVGAGIKVFDADKIGSMSFEEFAKPLDEETVMSNSRLISELFSDEGKIRGFELILRERHG